MVNKTFKDKTFFRLIVFFFQRITILLLFLGIATVHSQTTIDSEDFESGYGIWNDGGDDCRLDTTNPMNGGTALAIQDNSGSSRATSDNINLTAYASVTISFEYEGEGMESNEDFWVRYSDNGGSSWTTIATYISGTDFNNGTIYNSSINIDIGSYTFAANSQFRFQCDASNDADDVYIDNILIVGYNNLSEINLQGGLGPSNITDSSTIINSTIDTDFGSVDISSSSLAHSFTIQNTVSGSMLTLNNPVLSSGDTGDFSVTAVGSTSLSGITSTTFAVTFTPTASGTRTATVSITNSDSNENPYTFDVEGIGVLAPEIDITGLGISIASGNTPSISDDTDFGGIQLGSETDTKTFTINNLGGATLTLGTITLTGSSDFSITSSPATTIAAGASTTIQISCTTSSVAIITALLTIASDDSDESSYQINLAAEGTQAFFDSDGDGIYDDIDIDDDNDGIVDTSEEANCTSSSISNRINYKFLNESFGAGASRTTINTSYVATTTYCYEDGNGTTQSGCAANNNIGVQDGEYTIHKMITTGTNGETVGPNNAIASWAYYAWAPIEDHTVGDTDGRMAIFNAANDPGIFYETEIVGTLPGVPITYSFWAINIDNDDSVFSTGELDATGHRILPNITVNFLTPDGNTLLATYDTGDITRCSGDVFVPADHTGPGPHAVDATYNQCATSEWKYYEQSLTLVSNTTFIVQFVNNQVGGLGNDLAIDDIKIEQTLCDTDGDNIADLFDLDSDDDGIADVIEINLSSLNGGAGFIDYSIGSWIDANGDGLHDSAVGNTAPDTDSDGILDYLDLDSDNDTVFDVDESTAGNTSKAAGFVNGDGDINGDGTGNNAETEAFREKDTDGDGTLEYYGDGILDIYEHTVNTYGNTNQANPVDTDSDGAPDYLDVQTYTVYDISTTLYASLDANNDGVIDDTNDVDDDGILDLFDTDETFFGSPRDLDRDLYIHFDGRNDYAQDVTLLGGLTDATLMAWINIDDLFTNQGFIVGQDNFNLKLNSSKNLVATANGTSITYATPLDTSLWIHVAAIFDGGNTLLALYVNGENVNSTTSAPSTLGADTSFLTIAKNASTSSEYFYGGIEEVKILDIVLTELQLQKMIYQKTGNNGGQMRGEIIPVDIDVSWSNVLRYYRMDAYKDDVIDDFTSATIDEYPGTFARCYNIKDIVVETAPLPYITAQAGAWTDTATWLYGDIWDITTKEETDISNGYGSGIIHVKHDLTVDKTQSTTGLMVDSGVKLSIEKGTGYGQGLYNTWYLKLDGTIDLEDESQLIQTATSLLAVSSAGKIERDQQGTQNSYTYNYWSSPVSLINTTSNNATFTIADVLRDGTSAATPASLNFGSSYVHADGGLSSPRKISTYWIWKFVNNQTNDYTNWEWLGNANNLNVTEGYTMKGTSGASAISTDQNYVFIGKPNNAPAKLIDETTDGELVHTTFPATFDSNGNPRISLAGNPFPSALDAIAFIDDNIATGTNAITGTLYFWEHWSNNTHVLSNYQGGYATYTKMGGIPAASHPDINQSGAGTKTPGQYIPVGQGFFVYQQHDIDGSGNPTTAYGGDVVFKNSQRVFEVEQSNSESVFTRGVANNSETENTSTSSTQTASNKQRIWLGFESPNGFHRQVLAGFTEGATDSIDRGYDGGAIEILPNDAFFLQDNKYFGIIAYGEFSVDREIPIVIFIDDENDGGIQKIMIDELDNIADDIEIYIKDNTTGETHDLRAQTYEVALTSEEHKNRFSLVFRNNAIALSVDDKNALSNSMTIYMNNPTSEIEIHNTGDTIIEKALLYNSLGQKINSWQEIVNNNDVYLDVRDVSTGVYILKIETDKQIITKKVIIK